MPRATAWLTSATGDGRISARSSYIDTTKGQSVDPFPATSAWTAAIAAWTW
jgi:hypothetical protein